MQQSREKEANLIEFKENVDAWIKQINNDFSRFKHMPHTMNESLDNIQHNYELIRDLRQEMDDLKEEVRLLRSVNLALLRKTK